MANNIILERLEDVKTRFIEVSDLLTQPEILSDLKRYVKLNKEYKDLLPIVESYDRYKLALNNIVSTKAMLASEKDEEMREMAKAELEELTSKIPEMEEEIKLLIIPSDPEDDKNAVMEIRAGTGGDEASIFAGDLYRMYSKYCSDKGWKVDVVSTSEGTSGGFKEIIFEVTGEDVYGTLKFEAGVHRVQRVPQTETQGRVHTSTTTVMVSPEVEEFDYELDMTEVRIERTTSTGPGGQSVNTTYSAIKLHHEPTGMIVSCQDQKSSHKNLEKALKVLRSRLYERELEKQQEADSERRKSIIKRGDRSEKIRTYNYPQGRVTDHRIGLTLYDLSNIIDGDIQKIIDELMLAENTELLKASDETI
jgi:peptide chain release factor 1